MNLRSSRSVSFRDFCSTVALAVVIFSATGCSEGPLAASWGGGSAGVVAGGIALLQNPSRTQAISILSTNCTGCHGSAPGTGGVFNITDVDHLVSAGLVSPGSASSSQIFQQISANSMPPGSPLSSADKTTLQNWMNGVGAGTGGGGYTGPAVSFTTVETTILAVSCTSCHKPGTTGGGYDLTTYTNTMFAVNTATPTSSILYTTALTCTTSSPHHAVTLTTDQVNSILGWISGGAPNN